MNVLCMHRCQLPGIMAPRDVFDLNPIFGQAWWQSYIDFVRNALGHVHVQEEEDSEYDPHEEDAGDESVESEEMVWSVEPHEGFEVYDEEEESRIQEIMEFLASLGPNVGTRENPIDLTMDS